jgi:phage-related minor tail protein
MGMFSRFSATLTKWGATVSRIFGANSSVMKALRFVAGLAGAAVGYVTSNILGDGEEPAAGDGGGGGGGGGGGRTITRDVKQGAEAKRLEDEARRRAQAIEAINRQGEAYRKNTEEARKNLQIGYDQIGMNEDLIKIQEAGNKVTEASTREIERLEEQRARLVGEKDSAGQIAAIDAVIASIKRQTDADRAATEEIVRLGEARKRAYETEMAKRKEIMAIVAGGAEFRDQLLQQQQLADAENELIRKKLEMQFEMERANQQALLELRKKYVGQEIPQVELDALAQIRAARQAEYELNAKAMAEDFERKRTFEYGWTQAAKDALNQLTNTVEDQATYARNIFNTITNGFTNSIMKFVETGKLSFKDLFKSLMMEIIKMQMNKLFLSIFGKGGPLGTLFAGLFAEGGYIPSGKYGIVGESGPELMRGPGTVTSAADTAAMMGTGSGMVAVTYNINATDARSFKELVASDPAFIYNVTRLGARRIPR